MFYYFLFIYYFTFLFYFILFYVSGSVTICTSWIQTWPHSTQTLSKSTLISAVLTQMHYIRFIASHFQQRWNWKSTTSHTDPVRAGFHHKVNWCSLTLAALISDSSLSVFEVRLEPVLMSGRARRAQHPDDLSSALPRGRLWFQLGSEALSGSYLEHGNN